MQHVAYRLLLRRLASYCLVLLGLMSMVACNAAASDAAPALGTADNATPTDDEKKTGFCFGDNETSAETDCSVKSIYAINRMQCYFLQHLKAEHDVLQESEQPSHLYALLLADLQTYGVSGSYQLYVAANEFRMVSTGKPGSAIYKLTFYDDASSGPRVTLQTATIFDKRCYNAPQTPDAYPEIKRTLAKHSKSPFVERYQQIKEAMDRLCKAS